TQLRQAPRSVLVLVPTDLPERPAHVVRLAQPRLTHDHRCLHRPARFRHHHRPALLQLSTGEGPRRKGTSLCPRQQRPPSPGTPTTSWCSERAGPGSAPPSQPGRKANGPPSSPSHCSARPTRSWPRAELQRRWATPTPTTSGPCTFVTPSAVENSSTTPAWPNSTPVRPPNASSSSSTGVPCSTAPPRAGSVNATSVGTSIPGSHTWVTAPVWR